MCAIEATGREQAAARRRQPCAPWLENGFRPFFLGAAVWLPTALMVWLGGLADAVRPATHFALTAWHQHEMLFGGVGAIIAGFLLTAVPNWTGHLPVRGQPLLALFSLWALARVTGLTAGSTLPWLAALLDLGFLTSLLAFVGREIARGRNWRNLPVVGLLALFVAGAWLSQLDALEFAPAGQFGRRLGLAAVLLLISLVGGRIVPSFTRNWLVRMGVSTLPAPFGLLDKLVLGAWAVTLTAWLTAPAHVAAVLFLVAGFLHVARMLRWQGHRTFAEPLVTVLHAGYAWLGVGAVLYGLALDGLGLDAATALHALTTGAIGTMTLAVMTRASLGHTGRQLAADAATVCIYLLVTFGAVLRLLAPLGDYELLLGLAALAWGGAYGLFFLHYAPMLVRPRIETGGPD